MFPKVTKIGEVYVGNVNHANHVDRLGTYLVTKGGGLSKSPGD